MTRNRAEPPITCGATYTTVGGRHFVCVTKPHPNHPSQHYFVRTARPEQPRHRSMIRRPGER